MMVILRMIVELINVKMQMALTAITRYRLMMFFTINGIKINIIKMKELGIFMLMPTLIDVKIALDIISKMHFKLSVKL